MICPFFLGEQYVWRTTYRCPIARFICSIWSQARHPLFLAHTRRILVPGTFFFPWAARDNTVFVVTVAPTAAPAAAASTTAVYTTPLAGRRPNDTYHRRYLSRRRRRRRFFLVSFSSLFRFLFCFFVFSVLRHPRAYAVAGRQAHHFGANFLRNEGAERERKNASERNKPVTQRHVCVTTVYPL